MPLFEGSALAHRFIKVSEKKFISLNHVVSFEERHDKNKDVYAISFQMANGKEILMKDTDITQVLNEIDLIWTSYDLS